MKHPYCLFLLLPLLAACDTCTDEPSLKSASVIFSFRSKATGQDVISNTPRPGQYHPDSIRITDMLRQQMIVQPVTFPAAAELWQIGPFVFAQPSEQEQETKAVYQVGFSATDIDTIRIEYQVRKAECRMVVSNVDYYFNDSLVRQTDGFYKLVVFQK